MTDCNYAHIAFIADRSGSMSEVADPPNTKAVRTTQGIHEFVKAQKEVPGKTTFSLTHFDTGHELVEDLGDGSAIMHWNCWPRGGTALLDAVGTEITRLGAQFRAMPEDERPGRVYMVIGTDGEENSSKEYSLDRVKEMVAEQQAKYNWEFVFLGADIDAFSASASMGMAAASTLSASAGATMDSYAVSSDAVTRSRYSGQPVSYTDDERSRTS